MIARWVAAASILMAVGVPAGAAAPSASVVSRGARITLGSVLMPEGTTILLFTQDTSAMEQQYLADLEKQVPSGAKVALDVVRLKDVSAPAAQQFKVTATPTAVVFDRFGRELGRSSDAAEIQAAVRKGMLMGRIKWVDEDEPRAPEVYGAPAEAIKHGIPGIVKTMSMTPNAFRMFNIMSEIHFSDGFLKRRDHELIGAYVSGLNKCKY